MRILKLTLVFLTASFFLHVSLFAKDYPITDFGAVPDTAVLSTKAIQDAIDNCSLNGGGRVIIPDGQFITGTIILKDNVNLFLSHNAVLYGSRNINDYLKIKPDYIALRTREETRQLIFAENVTNISITGSGLIDGQGASFERVYGNEGITRPHLIQIINSEYVSIEGIRLRNSGAWMQHYLACDHLRISGIHVFNHSNNNNDGIDLDGCSNVVVSDVIIDSDDDGLCLKSTSGAGCENITFSNCIISSHCNAFKLGTESNTGFRNIVVSGMVIKPSIIQDSVFFGHVRGISGISIEMVDGGILEGLIINNIIIEGTLSPLFVRLGSRNRPYMEDQIIESKGILRDVKLSDIIVKSASKMGCSITGIPGNYVEDISLSNISIEFEGEGTFEDAGREIKEKQKQYPSAKMFGTLPSYGFFIRHAKNIQMSGIELKLKNEDYRPALVLEDVHHSEFSDIVMSGSKQNVSMINIKDSKEIILKECKVRGGCKRFLFLEGENNSQIFLIDNYLQNVDETDNLKEKDSKKIIYEVNNIK